MCWIFQAVPGRLSGVLADLGFQVSIADSSEHMVSLAKQWVDENGVDIVGSFVSDVLDPKLPEQGYDAILCNRLFHHFYEPDIRIQALNSLKRYASKRIVGLLLFHCMSGCLDISN